MANEEQIEQLGVNLSVTGSEKFGPDLDAAAAAMKGFTAETKAMEKASPKFDAAAKIIAASLKSINVASRGLDKSTASMNSFSAAMGNMSVNADKMAKSVNAAAAAQNRSVTTSMKPGASSSVPNIRRAMADRTLDAGSAQTIRAINARLKAEREAADKIIAFKRDTQLATVRDQEAQENAARAQMQIEKALAATVGRSAGERKAALQAILDTTKDVTEANIDGIKSNLQYRKTLDAAEKQQASVTRAQGERVAAVADRLRKNAMREADKARQNAAGASLGLTASKQVEHQIEATLQAQLSSIQTMARRTQEGFSEQALRDFRTFRTQIQAQAKDISGSISSKNLVGSQTNILSDVNKGKQRMKALNLSAEDRALADFEKRLRSSNTLVRTIAQSTLRFREVSSSIGIIFGGVADAIKGVYKAIVFILSPIRLAASLLTGLFRMLQRNTDESDKSARSMERMASAQRKTSGTVSRPQMARGQVDDGAAQKRSFLGNLRPQSIKVQADTTQAEQSLSRVKTSIREATKTSPKIRVDTDAGDTATVIDRVNVSTRKARNEMGQFAAQAQKTSAALSTVAPQASEASQKIIQIGVTARQTESALTKLFFVISGSFATGLGIGLAQSLFRAGGNAILSTIENIKNAISGLVSEAFTSISETENIMVSLNSLMASELVMSGQFENVSDAEKEASKGAQEMYDWVTKLAIVSPFEKQDILNVVQMGMGFGISSDNVKALTQSTVDWAAASGKSAAEMDSVMRAIGQISGGAVVAKEDLNQLRDAGLPAAEILAKMRGQTQGQFLQDVTDGAVKSTDAITMLTQYLNGQFNGAAAKAGGTLSGLTSSLRDIKSERLGQLFQPITDTLVKPILEMVVALAQAESAGAFFADLGGRIAALGSIVTGVVYSGFSLISQFFKSIPAEGVTFLETFIKVGAILIGVKLALVAVGIALSIFGATIGLVLSPIALLVAGITGLYLAWKNSLFGIREISVMASNAISSFVDTALTWIGDLYSNGSAYMNAFGQAVSDAVNWVLDTIWQLPEGFADVMDAVTGYGQNIIDMFADGIRASASLVVDALNYISEVISYWLQPGSPPKILPDLTTWGTGAADAYLEGWKKADFDMLKDLGGLIEGAMGSISNDALPIEQITKIREAVAATIGSFNETGKFDDSGIRAVSGPFAETLSNISRAYLETASSARVMASAQEQLEKSTEFYTNALKPLQDRLKQIQGLQSNSGLDQEAIELNRVLANTSATDAQKEAAKLRLEELNVQKEINALEGEQASKSEALQTQINAATKQNALGQENLDILKERFSVQQGIQEGIQANVRAAIAEANAIKQQVEKDVVGKSDAEAEKMRREAEKNADAQLALNLQMADTPGKIALLKDKLAGLTEGSTEYLETQKQIVALEQKRENEIESEAKALEAQGRKEEAAAKRAEAEARKQDKLRPGGDLALGGGASLAMPAKLDFTSLTAKFEESSLKIKESFKKVTEGIEPITQGLENVKTKVDSVVKSFQDGFGGKQTATDGFSKMVEDMGAKAKILDTNLKIAATGIQKFSVDFKAAFDAKEGSFTQKFSAALDETGVIEKINSFKTNVLATVDGKSGGFVTTFTDAFKLEPGSLTDKFKAGLDETGVTTAIDGFKANLTKRMDGLAQSPLGAEIKAKIQIVLQSLTVENITEKLNDLKQNLIDGLSSFTFENEDLEALRKNIVDGLKDMKITEEDVREVGKNILGGLAKSLAILPLLSVGGALLRGLTASFGGGGAMFSGLGSAIIKGLGFIFASPLLWIPLVAVIAGAAIKALSDAFNANTEGMGVMEKGQKMLDGMSTFSTAAIDWVTGMVNTVIDQIAKVDWLSASGAAGFTIGAGLGKLVAAIGQLLTEINWGSGIKTAIEFVGNVVIGLLAGLVTGLLWSLYDSIAQGGSEAVVKAIRGIFGLVTGAITGVFNVVSGIVNLFTDTINSALPEGYEIGRMPTLTLDADMKITTQEAIDKAKTDLENAELLVTANLNAQKTHGDIIQQFTDSGIGPAIAQRMSMQLGHAVESTDFTTMITGIQEKLGRQLTATDMVNLDPLLDEMNFEFERIALAILQSENAGEIVTKINEKLGTDFATTDFSGAGTALKEAIDKGMGASAGFQEFPGLQTLLDELGISVEAKAKTIGEKAKNALSTGMSSLASMSGSSAEARAGGGSIASNLFPDMTAEGEKLATDLAAGVDTGLAANTDLGLSFWEAAKSDWKSFWGIQSPSTVAHDEFGMPIGEGVLGGVTAALEAAPDPLGMLRTTIETSLTTILASISTFGAAAKAQFVVLKQSLTTTSIEQATAMKNLYAALLKDLLAKQVAFRLAIVKDTRLMYDEVKKIFVELSDDLKALMKSLYEEILRIVTNIRTESVAQFSTMKDEMVGVIEDMNEAIGEELDKLPGIFEEKLQAAIDVISSDTIADQFIKAGKDLGLVFLKAIADGLEDSTALKRIDDAIESIVSNMEDALVAALDQLADAVANATTTTGGTTETTLPDDGKPRTLLDVVLGKSGDVAGQVLASAVGASNELANQIVNRTGQQVTTGVQTGRTQQVIAPVNNSKTYILQMQVTPSQVERVSNNYAIFEAMTG